jgi:hypothetical protein
MYQVDEQDVVVELPDAPQPSVGAPNPVVLSDEATVVLAYYLEERPTGWDGTSVRVVGPTTSGEPLAVVTFSPYEAFMFGAPNDEAFEGHPLAGRGLHPYGVFEIGRSSWIRRLEQMNSVHPDHEPAAFASLRHFVFAFHDSTFECVAESFATVGMRSSIEDAFRQMKENLGWHAAQQ